jgi:hypothetical protein
MAIFGKLAENEPNAVLYTPPGVLSDSDRTPIGLLGLLSDSDQTPRTPIRLR